MNAGLALALLLASLWWAHGIEWKLVTPKALWVAREGHCLLGFADRLWILAGASRQGGPLNDVFSSPDGGAQSGSCSVATLRRHGSALPARSVLDAGDGSGRLGPAGELRLRRVRGPDARHGRDERDGLA